MQFVKQEIEKELEKVGIKNPKIEKPPENINADLSFPCFDLAKELKKSPVEIAKDFSSKLKPKYVKEIKPLGPYLNFYIDWGHFGEQVLQDVLKKKEKYGKGKSKGKYLVEFAHPNTHKAFHIGHVRNIALGESLCRILEFSGMRVVRVNYQGDIGPHVAKCLWGLKNLKLKGSGGKWLGQVYSEASKAIKGNEKLEDEVRQINKDLYAGKPELLKIWKETRQWSLDYFDEIYKDFGVKYDRFYFESEVEGPGIKLAKELEKKGIAQKSEGAIVIDLKNHNLGVYVLLTKDETPLYSIKDFVLAEVQNKEYKPDKIVHVVGAEQTLHFQQLFKCLEMTKPEIAKKEYHLSYNLVNLPTGKMSSREGNVILYEDLKEKMYELALEEAKKSERKNVEKIAKAVALGAIKYTMISQSPDKLIIFDWDKSLDFHGDTSPYIQYAYARAQSILKKSVAGEKKFSAQDLKEEKEKKLLKKISEFPELVEKSAENLQPHLVANFVFDLATLFNEFYQSVPVLKAEGRVLNSRLALVDAVSVVLKTCLGLVGIEALEEM